LAFAIDSFAVSPAAKSEMLIRIAEAFRGLEIRIGALAAILGSFSGAMSMPAGRSSLHRFSQTKADEVDRWT
jgi:hypothetical protein